VIVSAGQVVTTEPMLAAGWQLLDDERNVEVGEGAPPPQPDGDHGGG
jgi:hypothetical protein